MVKKFDALVVNKTKETFSVEIESRSFDDLPSDDVTIQVHYSSVNYKDGLASNPNGKIAQTYPVIPGIDLAGVVVSSKDARYKEGDQVIVTSYELGVSRDGGYSEYASVPAEWVVPLPDHLSLEEAMIFGTAGFTAALSIHHLEQSGLKPENGPVLVTGASGGVGSMAVSMLAKQHYDVEASTGKQSEHDYLKKLGAKEILTREDIVSVESQPLGKQRWAGAIDPVGGQTLASVLTNIQYGGAVAVSGLAGGTTVPTTVYPFILRGVQLLGIDSVYCPMDVRKTIWNRIATDLKPSLLDSIKNEISLSQLPEALTGILKGKMKGRTIVNVSK